MNTDLLRDTFQRARQENGGLTRMGMRFYERLFEKYPQVRPLFHTPPEEQHKKLMASVGAIVASAQNPSELLPYLHAMGIRHLKYGTENGHYAAVGENLVAVLSEHLSVEGEWTSEMQETWEAALKLVSDIMIQAADNPESFTDELKKSGYEADGFSKRSNEPWKLASLSS